MPASLAVAQRRDHGNYSGDKPDEKQDPRRADGSRNICADNENARTDHRTDDDHGRIEKLELALELPRISS